MKQYILSLVLILSFYWAFPQGPYAPKAGDVGSTAIHKDSSVFIGWTNQVSVQRGWQNIANTSLGKVTVGDEQSVKGIADGGIISLGDGGEAIITISGFIYNDNGPDFAVFENSFSDDFLELAHVEVSSDGINYFRFPSVCATPNTTQLGTFGLSDPTNIYNLAGKYRGLYGTPFDLEELKDSVGLDINNITHIKIIDVVGNVDPAYASFDSQGNIINDPWPTSFESGGFDLDAIGLIHATINTTSDYEITSSSEISLFPNPVKDRLNISTDLRITALTIHSIEGKIVFHLKNAGLDNRMSINTSNFEKGYYLVTLRTKNGEETIPFIVNR